MDEAVPLDGEDLRKCGKSFVEFVPRLPSHRAGPRTRVYFSLQIEEDLADARKDFSAGNDLPLNLHP